jgi:hypothetical protein
MREGARVSSIPEELHQPRVLCLVERAGFQLPVVALIPETVEEAPRAISGALAISQVGFSP